MTRIDFIALSPLITIALVSLAITLVIAFCRRHLVVLISTLIALALCLLVLPIAASVAPHEVAPLFIIDQYALFYIGLMLLAAVVVALLAYGYLKDLSDQPEEFYLLLLLSTLGGAVLAASNHFISLFLGLETLSVALFALAAYSRHFRPSLEASLKYLILSGASSATLLIGMALIYAELGTMEFDQLGALLRAGTVSYELLFPAGLALIMVGLGFKLSLAPFHLWTPDVYQGSPAPVTAFLATVSKGAVFALLLRFFIQSGGYDHHALIVMLSLVAFVTILIGNLLALLQNNVKRILAYSSIAHLGYLLVALLAGERLGVEAVLFYWVAYFVMNLGAFGVVTVLSSPAREKENLEDYQGLFWQRPVVAGIFTLMLLSLAGIPLTIGFIGKFYIFAVGVNKALWLLLLAIIIGSILGLFYYLRVIIALYRFPDPGREGTPADSSAIPLASSLTLILLALLLLWWGVYPDPLMQLIEAVVVTLI